MWDRVVFKDRAKAIMKDHYWKVFIACLIASFLGLTGSDGFSFEIKKNTEAGTQFTLDLGFFNFNVPLDYFSVVLGIMLVFMIFVALAVGIALSFFVFNVLRVGFCRYLVLTQRYGHPADIGEIFWGFGCGHYLNLVKTMFFRDLYIFLYFLALIIPGIIKSYEYTCVPYILAEHPEMDYRDVLDHSSAMTNGYKGEIFILRLSFFGWAFLGAMLFGIGTLFVTPYVELTNGEMYAFLRDRITPDFGGNGYQDPNGSQGYFRGYTY